MGGGERRQKGRHHRGPQDKKLQNVDCLEVESLPSHLIRRAAVMSQTVHVRKGPTDIFPICTSPPECEGNAPRHTHTRERLAWHHPPISLSANVFYSRPSLRIFFSLHLPDLTAVLISQQQSPDKVQFSSQAALERW